MDQITVDDRTISIEYRFQNRRKSTLGFHYHPQGILIVDAPFRTSREWAAKIISQNHRIVARLIRETHSSSTIAYPINYTTGTTIYYLGVPMQLKVDPTSLPHIVVDKSKRELNVPFTNDTKRLVTDWYTARADEVFSCRIQKMCRVANFIDELPEWSHRFSASRWGSCTSQNRVRLNTHLIKLPLPAIDSVIMHELCHFREKNHGVAFYALLSENFPDWRKQDEIIRKYSLILHEKLS